MKEFANTPFLDFSKPENARAMREALEKVRSQLGGEYDIVIGGERIKGTGTFRSTNPSRPSEVVGVHQSATPEIAKRAIDVAAETFLSWSRRPARERADYLFAAAEGIRRRRCEFSAWMVLRGRQDAGPRPTATPPRRSTSSSSTRREMLRYAGRSAAHAAARREERARLHPARRRRRHPAVELPARDHGRHDDAPRSSPATRSC